MGEYEIRKMSIFNQLNFFGIAMGLIVPLISIFALQHLPPLAWYVAASPLAIGIIVLWLNYEQYHEFARMVYFSFCSFELLYFMVGLLNDAQALPHFLAPDQPTVIIIAGIANGYRKVKIFVTGIRRVNPHIIVNTGSPEVGAMDG